MHLRSLCSVLLIWMILGCDKSQDDDEPLTYKVKTFRYWIVNGNVITSDTLHYHKNVLIGRTTYELGNGGMGPPYYFHEEYTYDNDRRPIKVEKKAALSQIPPTKTHFIYGNQKLTMQDSNWSTNFQAYRYSSTTTAHYDSQDRVVLTVKTSQYITDSTFFTYDGENVSSVLQRTYDSSKPGQVKETREIITGHHTSLNPFYKIYYIKGAFYQSLGKNNIAGYTMSSKTYNNGVLWGADTASVSNINYEVGPKNYPTRVMFSGFTTAYFTYTE